MSKLREQLGLMHDIRVKANINIVTCGHCDTILLHHMDDETITCWGCKKDMSTSDCTDFLYEGMPELDAELSTFQIIFWDKNQNELFVKYTEQFSYEDAESYARDVMANTTWNDVQGFIMNKI